MTLTLKMAKQPFQMRSNSLLKESKEFTQKGWRVQLKLEQWRWNTCMRARPVPCANTLTIPHTMGIWNTQYTTMQHSTYTYIVGILLSLARTLGLKQNVCCFSRFMSGLLSPVAIFTMGSTPFSKSPVIVQLSEWQVTVHLYVRQYGRCGQWLHMTTSYTTLDKPQAWFKPRSVHHCLVRKCPTLLQRVVCGLFWLENGPSHQL